MATRSNPTRHGGDIVRFDPWSDMRDLRRTMDNWFGQLGGVTPNRFFEAPSPAWGGWEPNVELYETQDELVFTADLPGFNQEDVDLQLTADSLQLVANHRDQPNPQPEGKAKSAADDSKTPKEGESKPATGSSETKKEGESNGSESTSVQSAQPQHPRNYHIQGQQRRSFSVTYGLPVEVNPDKAEATFKNGVLELHMPKSERNRPKQVKVQLHS